MATRYFGERIKRNEDPKLLTGQALFVDDVNLPGMLHIAFVRSPYAHARIKSVDATAARALEGVEAVYTAGDLGDYWRTGVLNVGTPPIEGAVFHERLHPIIAKDKVRHVGEIVACVVAENRYIAEDAANLIMVDYEPLPVHIDPKKAMEDGAALIHDDLDSNLAAHVVQHKGDYANARQQADVVIEREFVYDRGTAAALEVVGRSGPPSERIALPPASGSVFPTPAPAQAPFPSWAHTRPSGPATTATRTAGTASAPRSSSPTAKPWYGRPAFSFVICDL